MADLLSGTWTVVRVCCIAGAVGTLTVGGHSVASAAGTCTNIQAQCAIEIGGTCDPKTGKWRYARGADRFNACISRKLAEQKKH